MALFTSRYLASTPFDLKVSDEIQSYALSGYYNMHDYAVTSWWHHTHQAIEDTSSLSTELFSDMVESLSVSLRTALKAQSGEPSDSTTPGTILARFRQLPTDDRAREDFGNLSTGTLAIREVIETIWTLMSHNPDFQKSIGLQLYGSKQYKCSNTWCHRFSDGFQGSKQRDDHMNQHFRPFRCSFDGCFAGALGFPSEKQLQQHVSRHHREPEKLRFPTARSPVKQRSMFLAIRAGDLEAVKESVRKSIEVKGIFDFDVPVRLSRPVLTLAVEYKQFDICQYLLEVGASPVQRELREAIAGNDADILGLLISHIPSAKLAVMDFGSLFSSSPGPTNADAQRTFVSTIALHHPRFKFSDSLVLDAIKQDLLEIVKYCLTHENDMFKQRLEERYDEWMSQIMRASQECFHVLLAYDTSGVVMTQAFFEAHVRCDVTILSRLPSLTPEISEWIGFQWYRDHFANREPFELPDSLVSIISKLRPKNTWDLLGVSFCFYPLDLRLRRMNRNSFREILNVDNSLCFQKDKNGATLLHGIIGEGDIEMVELITAVPGIALNATCRLHGDSDGVTPLSLALSRMTHREAGVSLKWAKIVYMFLSTEGTDISKISTEDELTLLMAAASSNDQELQRIVEKVLSLLCPTATADKIQRLMQQLPSQAGALHTLLSITAVDIQRRHVCLTNLMANPNVFDCLIKHGDISGAAKLLVSQQSESYQLPAEEKKALAKYAIQMDDAVLLQKVLTMRKSSSLQRS